MSDRPFLVVQLRPEREAADDEFAAILRHGGLAEDRVRRVDLCRDPAPDPAELDLYAGVIVGGGPGCVSDPPDEKPAEEARIEAAVMALMPRIVGEDMPYLGCCYGIGVLGAHLGAPVGKGRYGEPVGASDCRLTPDGAADPLLAGLPERFAALVGHKEAVEALPPGCTHLVASDPCPFQMIRYGRNVYATQFHPEGDGDGFAVRIGVYRDRGYFPPEEAEALEARVRAVDSRWPPLILRNFVDRYG
ncbi:glutamine amidotransferase [Rhodobacteraceae bacterium CCMM004]|nr:glutamine amidotransferase [Rhodobacteraceae bacterium CCMM004]